LKCDCPGPPSLLRGPGGPWTDKGLSNAPEALKKSPSFGRINPHQGLDGGCVLHREVNLGQPFGPWVSQAGPREPNAPARSCFGDVLFVSQPVPLSSGVFGLAADANAPRVTAVPHDPWDITAAPPYPHETLRKGRSLGPPPDGDEAITAFHPPRRKGTPTCHHSTMAMKPSPCAQSCVPQVSSGSDRSTVSAAERAATTLRRGLRRPEAATYIGISPSLFDQLVEEGSMPKPFKLRTCTLWDIRDLDLAFDAAKNDRPNPLDAKWLS
jgi:predicted DNA-binding transcriptional regulator AlpA